VEHSALPQRHHVLALRGGFGEGFRLSWRGVCGELGEFGAGDWVGLDVGGGQATARGRGLLLLLPGEVRLR
jgi:hypothetical protein